MPRQIRDVVHQYVDLVGSGSADEIVDLYAPDAIVEDPVGTQPKQGHDAIREFYNVLASVDRDASLYPDSVRVAGKHAAFMFALTTTTGDQKMTLHPIDAMEFDDEGKIVHMRAYWGPDDMHVEEG